MSGSTSGSRNVPSSNQLSTQVPHLGSITGHNNATSNVSEACTYHEASGSQPYGDTTNSYDSNPHSDQFQYGSASTARDPSGVLLKAPRRDIVDSGSILPKDHNGSPALPPLTKLQQVEFEHDQETAARVQALHPKERRIVNTDGGNTLMANHAVLDSLEKLPACKDGHRAWTVEQIVLPNGKKSNLFRCRALNHDDRLCDKVHNTAQKASQHLVSSHVDTPCWTCPVKGCLDPPRYKRLDDLKHHHIAPVHLIDYWRPRGGRGPAKSTQSTSQADSMPEGNLSTRSGTSMAVRNDPKTARTARQTNTANPLQVSRPPRRQHNPAMAVATFENDEPIPNVSPYHDTTSPNLLSPNGVHANALASSSQVDHRSLWPSPSSDPDPLDALLSPPSRGVAASPFIDTSGHHDSPLWPQVPSPSTRSPHYAQSFDINDILGDFRSETNDFAFLRAQSQDRFPRNNLPPGRVHQASTNHAMNVHRPGAIPQTADRALDAQWQQQRSHWTNPAHGIPDTLYDSAPVSRQPQLQPRRTVSPSSFTIANDSGYPPPSFSYDPSHLSPDSISFPGYPSYASSPITSPVQARFANSIPLQPVGLPRGNELMTFPEIGFDVFDSSWAPDFLDHNPRPALLLSPVTSNPYYSSNNVEEPPRFDPLRR